MDETQQLVEVLRLADDPPGGVSGDALEGLVREDGSAPWDIATMAQHVGVSPHALRYSQLLLSLVATEYKIAAYGGATQP